MRGSRREEAVLAIAVSMAVDRKPRVSCGECAKVWQ